MCMACVELTKVFNRAIQKAQDLEDKAFESQLKEKREWFLREVWEKDHKVAKTLLEAFFTDDDSEIDQDSGVLDGKQWDQVLDVKFKPRTPVPHPPIDQQVPTRQFAGVKLDELDEIIKEIEDKQISFKWTEKTTKEASDKVKAEAEQEFEVVAQKATCGHNWVIYEGAGTKPPEKLCSKCGASKT